MQKLFTELTNVTSVKIQEVLIVFISRQIKFQISQFL